MRTGPRSHLVGLAFLLPAVMCIGTATLGWLGRLEACSVLIAAGTAGLFGLLIAAHRDGLRVDRRRREGRCPHCGYELRGSRHAHRCPECGAPTTFGGSREL